MNNGVTTTHSDAEAARQSAVNAQEAADAWRKGSTPNAGPVLALSQAREPYYGSSLTNATMKSYDVDAGYGDAYETSFHNTRLEMRAKQDAHLYDQQAKVADQEETDSWRKGYTPASGPVVLNQRRGYSLVQGVDDRDQGYYHSYSNMNNGVTTAHSTAEAARQAAVNAQEAADAWRKGSTPSAGPVYPYGLYQRRG